MYFPALYIPDKVSMAQGKPYLYQRFFTSIFIKILFSADFPR